MALDTETISDAGAHADLTADYRLPALKGAFSLGTPGYFTQGFLRSLVAASFVLANFSTTARDALVSPLAGQAIYNTTTNVPNVYASGTWQAFALLGTANTFTALTLNATPVTVNEAITAATLTPQTAPLLVLGGSTAAILFERPAGKSLNGISFSLVANQNPYIDGSGVGGQNYNNEVMWLGWNGSTTIGARLVSGYGAIGDIWEQKFNNGGKYVVERHIALIDTSGNIRKFFSAALPHDGSSGASGAFAIDRWDFNTLANVNKIIFNMINNEAFFGDLTNAFKFNFQKNNVTTIGQLNVAGNAYVYGPYINSSDQWYVDIHAVHNLPLSLKSYAVATVPSAAIYIRGLIYVSDEAGGAMPAFSDGTNWRRVTDRAVVS